MGEVRIPIDQVIKRIMVQLKYEEIGSWLITHNVPLFYAHKNGFTIIDKKYIDEQSFIQDCRIILRTLFTIVMPETKTS